MYSNWMFYYVLLAMNKQNVYFRYSTYVKNYLMFISIFIHSFKKCVTQSSIFAGLDEMHPRIYFQNSIGIAKRNVHYCLKK